VEDKKPLGGVAVNKNDVQWTDTARLAVKAARGAAISNEREKKGEKLE